MNFNFSSFDPFSNQFSNTKSGSEALIMSQAKNDASEKLMVSASATPPASERIPIIARPFVSDKAKKTLDIVCLNPISYLLRQLCRLRKTPQFLKKILMDNPLTTF